MEDNKTSDKVYKCLHCGNDTLMYLRGTYKWTDDDDGFYWTYKHYLYECPVCHMATLVQRYDDVTMCDYACGDKAIEYEEHIVFPVSRIDNGEMPKHIRQAYESALKIRNIDVNVSMIALRRTLELVLLDKGATSTSIKGKIENLASRGLLPEALKEISDTTRLLGNIAAHGRDPNFSTRDVTAVSEFLGYIIDYLYVLPCKIAKQKERLVGMQDTK